MLVSGLEGSDEPVLCGQGKSAPSHHSLFPLLEWFGFLWMHTQQSAPLTSSDISGPWNSRCSHAVHVCTFCFLSRTGKHTSSCWLGPLSLLARRGISQHTACLVDIGADVSRVLGSRRHNCANTDHRVRDDVSIITGPVLHTPEIRPPSSRTQTEKRLTSQPSKRGKY